MKGSSVAALILAAGASSRLGSSKQLVRLGIETLLQRAVRVSVEAGLHPVYGVISADLVLEAGASPMIPIVNQKAAEGIASSIRAGLQAVQSGETRASGVLLLTCDQPAVTAEHLRELARSNGEVIASAYAGRKGVPAYFPVSAFAELLALRGDVGARDLLQAARAIDLPGGELDVDTVEDLERARKLYST